MSVTTRPILPAANSSARDETWRRSWGAAPTPRAGKASELPEPWAQPVLSGQTVVQRLRLSAGGSRLRLRLTNEYGAHPVEIGRACVAPLDGDGAAIAAGTRAVTFAGAASAILGGGEAILSDPLDLATAALGELRVSLFLPGAAVSCTWHPDGGDTTLISPRGDYADRPFEPALTTHSRPILSGVDVAGGAGGPVIVTLGDSITDGHRSSLGRHRRWPDRLAERLASDARLNGAAVVNAGVSGNRLLGSDPLAMFGDGALTRFERDVLSVPGVTHLIVLEGINDLCAEPIPAAETLIDAYGQLVRRAHARGVKVILGTIMAFGGSDYFGLDAEAQRQAVNIWIRDQGQADGRVDFDAVTRDPLRLERLKPGLHAGDWMHPNDAGYRVMGEAIPLGLFR